MHDVEEKKRRGYSDPKTRVYFDGRERLAGIDWVRRKKELWERCGGRCERWVGKWGGENHDRCRSEAHDPHHIEKRSKKRDDRLSNLMALCRMHHDLLDERKPRLRTIPVGPGDD